MSVNFQTYTSNMTEEIQRLFSKSFAHSEGESEGAVIGNLAGKLVATTRVDDIHVFVATEDDRIVGCIIFSRMSFESSENAFLLSPVAIDPDYQGQGIGQKLITFGLEALREYGVELAFTYGNPKFYSKVGFRQISEDTVKAPLALSQPEGWLGQSLVGDKLPTISGNSYCVDALNDPNYW